jgi:Trk K+ transport system NAD-binding subunit
VGKSLQARDLSGPIMDSKIVAVLRGKSVILARPATILQPGDRLVLVASQKAQAELLRHLGPPFASALQPSAPDQSQ